MTQSAIERGIARRQELLESMSSKVDRGEVLRDVASELHGAAYQFTKAVREYVCQRDKTAIDQLSDTNAILERSFVALNEYSVAKANARSNSVKVVLLSTVPFAPLAVYFLHSRVHAKKEIIDQNLVKEQEVDNILFMIS
jgi:hypothetical protein